MLAIVTPNPDSIAETFIRQHIRLITPNNTAVIYFEGNGLSVQDCPNLKIDNSKTNFIERKIRGTINYITMGYSGALVGKEKETVINFFKTNNITCVLAEFGQTACKIQSVCQEVQIPLYAFFHGHDAGTGGRSLKNKYSYWRMGQYARKIFVATKFFANKVATVGISQNKIYIAPYGLEINNFSPNEYRDREPNLIIAVGRMVEKKAPHLTVEAFSKVQEKISHSRLEIIGDGPLLERAKAKAVELGIENKVIFHGAKDHDFVKNRVSQAALFVQHSVTASNGDTESLGVSLLEAMACEVPVVTTRHNGFVETVVDGVTGFLVEEKDVDEMAQRMIQILENPELQEKMGKAGRQHVIDKYEAKQQALLLAKLMDV